MKLLSHYEPRSCHNLLSTREQISLKNKISSYLVSNLSQNLRTSLRHGRDNPIILSQFGLRVTVARGIPCLQGIPQGILKLLIRGPYHASCTLVIRLPANADSLVYDYNTYLMIVDPIHPEFSSALCFSQSKYVC